MTKPEISECIEKYAELTAHFKLLLHHRDSVDDCFSNSYKRLHELCKNAEKEMTAMRDLLVKEGIIIKKYWE